MPLMPMGPTKNRLLSCTIGGVDVRGHVTCIRAFETMCKSYITCEIEIIDNTNFVNGLGLKGFEQVVFAFDAPGAGGPVYSQVQYIFSIDAEEQLESLRTIKYVINTMGINYFKDRANLVQRADQMIPSTAAAAAIHAQYLNSDAGLEIKAFGGIIAKLGNPYITVDRKPIKAIEDILSKIAFGGYATGAGLYYRDAHAYVMAPLQERFASMSSQQSFWQKATWGGWWESSYGGGPDAPSTNLIIYAKTTHNDAALAATAGGQAHSMFDLMTGLELINKMASGGGFCSGGGGGVQNTRQLDSRQNDPAVDQGMNAVAENAYLAAVKNSTNYTCMVPLQSGIFCTVGKGATIYLIPPIGDLAANPGYIGGLGLLADVRHEAFFDERTRQGTTTFRWVADPARGVQRMSG